MTPDDLEYYFETWVKCIATGKHLTLGKIYKVIIHNDGWVFSWTVISDIGEEYSYFYETFELIKV